MLSIRRYRVANIPDSFFLLLLETFEPAYISGVKTLRLLAYFWLHPAIDFLTPMTALEVLEITSNSGLINSIYLLAGVDQPECSFPHLKTLTYMET